MYEISMSYEAFGTALRILREGAEALVHEDGHSGAARFPYSTEASKACLAIDEMIESMCGLSAGEIVDTLRYPLDLKRVCFDAVTQEASDKYGMERFTFNIEAHWIEKKLGDLPKAEADYITFEIDADFGNTLYIRI